MNIAFTTAPACAQWAERLALHPEDLSPTDREAIEAHVASCLACQAVREAHGVMADQIQALASPVLTEQAPRWLVYAQRESTVPFQRRWSAKRSLVACIFLVGIWWRDWRPAWLPIFPSWATRPRVGSLWQEYMSPWRKVLLLPVPFCLALAVSVLCWQLGQIAGFWLLGLLCALLTYPGIALPLLFRLLLPIHFRPWLSLKQRLVCIPALLVTASGAGASWLALMAQNGAHLGRWEVEWWCGLIGTTCLVLACV